MIGTPKLGLRTRSGMGRTVSHDVREGRSWARGGVTRAPAAVDRPDCMRRFAFRTLAALTLCTSAPLRLLAQDAPGVATMATVDFAWQRPELLRYNRVEGLSVGARGAVRFGLGGAAVTAALTARLGTADREPRVTVAFERETVSHAIAFSAYRELQTVHPA